MERSLGSRLKNAWNAFRNKSTNVYQHDIGIARTYRPDRARLTRGNERSIITSIFSRIAVDSASIDIKHIKTDENDRFIENVNSKLNHCLTVEANMDQSARVFLQDVVLSMLDEGCVAIVPVDTNFDPRKGAFDILSMRTGRILEWYPKHVKVKVYNERVGRQQDIILPKKSIAIIENPFYSIMNEPNSTMQRLTRKLVLLDNIDEKSNSGKLDLLFQLPYQVKGELRKKQADERRESIINQLEGSKYGIAYIDATEKVTQLNRPIENNLLTQIESLTNTLFSQLSISQSILDGTASESVMLNYYNRTIEPIISAITDELYRKFLSKTARTQHQTIAFFRDPFKLVPVSNIAEIADKLTRNEIATSNEIRQIIGWKPSDDPNADELRNSNIRQAEGIPPMEEDYQMDEEGYPPEEPPMEEEAYPPEEPPEEEVPYDDTAERLDELDAKMDDINIKLEELLKRR